MQYSTETNWILFAYARSTPAHTTSAAKDSCVVLALIKHNESESRTTPKIMKKKAKTPNNTIGLNKKARFDYFLLQYVVPHANNVSLPFQAV